MSNNNPQVEAHLQAMRERMAKAWQERGNVEIADGYPADVVDILQLVCGLWNLRLPSYKKDKGYWIEGARRLMDAAGKNWQSVLQSVYEDWSKQDNPYTVSSPTSLVNMARAKEAMMGVPRRSALTPEQEQMAERERRARERMEK